MRFNFNFATSCRLAVVVLGASLAACGDDPEPVKEKKTESIVTVAPKPPQPPKPPEPDRIAIPAVAPPPEGWISADAPNACDVLSDTEAAEVLGARVKAFDITGRQQQRNRPVSSACLFAFGKVKDPESRGEESKFVRVQVFTDTSLGSVPGRNVDAYFNARRTKFYGALELGPGFEAFWTTSDHPPDRALVIRNGAVVLEVQSYPPSSGAMVAAPRSTVEAFVLSMYEKWL